MKNTIKTLIIFLCFCLSMSSSNAFSRDSKNFSFDSVIVDAAEKRQKNIVEMLLSEGVNPDEQGKFETTPLHRAAFNGYDDIVSVLLSKGADPNMKDFGGAAPLHMAARKGNIDVVRKLIEAGADLELQDNEGFTALQRAISNNNTAVGVFLLEAGASPKNVDSAGNTPLIEAVRIGNKTLVEELILQGASKDNKNNLGITASDYASKKGDDEIIELLSRTSSDIKRQRAIKGNNIIVVSESELSNNRLPTFLHKEVEIDGFPALQNKYSLEKVGEQGISQREISGDDLPWLKGKNYVSGLESTTVRPISIFEAEQMGGVSDSAVIPNMPIVRTARVEVADSEITEDQISEILSEESSNLSGSGSKDNFLISQTLPDLPVDVVEVDKIDRLGFGGLSSPTRPVDKIEIVRDGKFVERHKTQISSNAGSNVIDLGAVDKSDFKAIGYNLADNYKLKKNEVDYSNYNLDSLPASLKVKYLASMKGRKVSSHQHSSLVSRKLTTGAEVAVKPVKISESTYRAMPVARVTKVSEEPLFLQRERELGVSNRIESQVSLVDKGIEGILHSDGEKLDINHSLPKVEASTANYRRGALINDINRFYNGKGDNLSSYNLSSLEAKRNQTLGIGGSVSRKNNKLSSELKKVKTWGARGAYRSSPSHFQSPADDLPVSSNLPKSQIYKKLLAEKANKELPSSIAYSDINLGDDYRRPIMKKVSNSSSYEVPSFLISEASSGVVSTNANKSVSIFKDAPASLDNSKTKTDSLLSWEGFSSDDLDNMYNEVVLGVGEKDMKIISTPSVLAVKPIKVEDFPKDGILKSGLESDIVKVKTVKAVPVQISTMETLKPRNEDIMPTVTAVKAGIPDLSKFETKIDDAAPNVRVKNTIEAKKPNIPDLSKFDMGAKNDDDLTGNHSIIGGFATTDDAVSYFNSISSRLGFAYNHKILKSKDDGKYYIAIGRLKDDKVAERLCKAYASDYVTCLKSNSKSPIEGFNILKIKKVYSILGEFTSAKDAKLYFSKKIADKNINYKVAKAGSSGIYLLQLGPLSDGVEAKKLCEEIAGIDQKCKITVK